MADSTKGISILWGCDYWTDPFNYRSASDVYDGGEYHDFEDISGWTTSGGSWGGVTQTQPTWYGGEYSWSRDPNAKVQGDSYVMVGIQGSVWDSKWRTPFLTFTNLSPDGLHWENYGEIYKNTESCSYMSAVKQDINNLWWSTICICGGEVKDLANSTDLFNWQKCPGHMLEAADSYEELIGDSVTIPYGNQTIILYDAMGRNGAWHSEVSYFWANSTMACGIEWNDHGSAIITHPTGENFVENIDCKYNPYDNYWYAFCSVDGCNPGCRQKIYIYKCADDDFGYDMTSADWSLARATELSELLYMWTAFKYGTPRIIVNEDGSIEIYHYGQPYDGDAVDNFIGQATSKTATDPTGVDWTTFTPRNVGKEYYQYTTESASIAYTSGNYTNFELTADIAIKPNATASNERYASIIFRRQDDDNCYRVLIDNTDDLIYMQREVATSWTNLGNVSILPQLQSGHHVALRVRAYLNTFSVHYNNYGDRWEEIWSGNDSSHSWGSIGIGSYGCQAYFDNVRASPYISGITITNVASVETLTPDGDTLRGEVTDTGAGNIIERGFIWSTSPITNPGDVAPDVWDDEGDEWHWTEEGNWGTGVFTHTVDLEDSTIYYVRAGAENEVGWIYGGLIVFDTTCCISEDLSLYEFGVISEGGSYTTGISHFTLTNCGDLKIDVYISAGNMTSLGSTWIIAVSASNTEYALKAGLDDDDGLYDVAVIGSITLFIDDMGSGTTQSWGLKLYAPLLFADGYEHEGNVTLDAIAI